MPGNLAGPPKPIEERRAVTSAGSRTVALVAGGAGFIGSHLIDSLLGEGARVIALDNFRTGRRENLRHLEREPRFDLLEADVIDALPSSLARARPTRIYNLACAASPQHYQADPEHTMLTNVVGTRNLLRLAEETGARFLLSSTSEVYGDPEVHPQPESYRGSVSCTGPRACYDEGKRAAEALAFDFRRQSRAEIRVARLFNTYGPRMRPDDGRVVANFVCQALGGRDITVYGDGLQTRSFCFVADMVDGLIRLMESDLADGPVNLGNPQEVDMVALVSRIVDLTGARSPIVHRPLPTDDPRRRKPDISRAKAVLGWEPRTGLDEGLEATIAWFAQEREQAGRARLEPLTSRTNWRGRPSP
jgi:UDP-glucuronate decarboxylase